jgi:hypothetical protein
MSDETPSSHHQQSYIHATPHDNDDVSKILESINHVTLDSDELMVPGTAMPPIRGKNPIMFM